MKIKAISILFLFAFGVVLGQVDIVPTLKLIESGEITEAHSNLKRLRYKYPKDENVKFLDAVLTENGEEALQKYSLIYTQFPKAQFADAALYRVFSYYYSLGIYNKAEKFLTKLKEDYPNSPYIKVAERNLPSEDFFIQTKNETSEPPKVATNIKPDYKYTIQAGAFLNKTNAKNLVKKYQAKGVYAKTYTKDVGGSLLNIVLIGKFKNKNSAQSTLDELKKNFKLNGRVVTLK